MKKQKLIIISVITSSLLIALSVNAYAAVTPGTKCAKIGMSQIYKGKIYACIKLGKKLYWNNGVSIAKTPTPTLAPTVTKVPSVKTNPELQYFYSSAGCKNKLGYVRFGPTGKILQNKILVTALDNVQLTPSQFYGGKLLFIAFDCDDKSSSYWSIGFKNGKLSNEKLLKLEPGYFGVSAGWDIASGTGVALINTPQYDQQVISLTPVKQVLWSLTSSGWGSRGYRVKQIVTETGHETNIFLTKSSGGWAEIIINPSNGRTGIYDGFTDGQGSSIFYATTKGIFHDPWFFATNTGFYLCVTPHDVGQMESNSNCNNIAKTNLNFQVNTASLVTGSMATAWSPQTAESFGEALWILPNKLFSYKTGPLIGYWSPIATGNTVTLDYLNAVYIAGCFQIDEEIGLYTESYQLVAGDLR